MSSVLLIDDHSLFRAGIAMVLANGLPQVSIHEAASLEQALLLTELAPALILLDVQLHGMSGLEGIGLLKAKWPDTRIVMVSAQDLPQQVADAQKRGAVGFLSKTAQPDRLLHSVVALLPDSDVASNQTGETFQPNLSGGRPLLTPRQHEVLGLLGRGLSNKMIGRHLDLSEHTVRGHVQATLSALAVSSRTEAVFVARQQGLIG